MSELNSLIYWQLPTDKEKLLLLYTKLDENIKSYDVNVKTFTKREVGNLIKMLYYYKKQMKDS